MDGTFVTDMPATLYLLLLFAVYFLTCKVNQHRHNL